MAVDWCWGLAVPCLLIESELGLPPYVLLSIPEVKKFFCVDDDVFMPNLVKSCTVGPSPRLRLPIGSWLKYGFVFAPPGFLFLTIV